MATRDPMHVSLFWIQGDHDHWAAYDYRVDREVTSGGHDDLIKEVVQTDRRPTDGHKPSADSTRPDRFLDIRETRTSGKCIYAFRLDADTRETRLRFVPRRPFIPLPLNAKEDPDFLTEFDVEYGGAGIWASFACNLAEVHNSQLATRIRAATAAHGHALHPVLTIPFCFNVIDQGVLKASPWAVPRHSHSHLHGRDLMTHGGVHPPEVAFLSVELLP